MLYEVAPVTLSQEIVAWPEPSAAATPVGANGAMDGVAKTWLDSELSPTAFTAVTTK
jgi:hypothetical protein